MLRQAILMALLILPAAAANLSFEAPAQVDVLSGANIEAAWILIVVEDGSRIKGAIDNPGGWAESMERRRLTQPSIPFVNPHISSLGPEDWVEPQEHEAGFTASYAGRSDWASMIIEASRLNVSVTDRWTLRDHDGCLGDVGIPQVIRDALATPGNQCMDSRVLMEARLHEGPIIVNASGASKVVFHNIDIRCGGAPACPDGGSRTAMNESVWPVRVRNKEATFSFISGEAMELQVEASRAYVVTGAPQLDVAFVGTGRFPGATTSDCIQSTCISLADQTLLVEGAVELTDIAQRSDGRLGGRMSANPSSVRVDEKTMVESMAPAIATAGLVAGLVAAVKLGLVGLRSLAQQDPLRSPRRQALMAYIERQPGATFRELVRNTEIPSGTARHHVAVLRRAGLIHEQRHHQTLRYFAASHASTNRIATVMLRDEQLARLHEWLEVHPQSPQKDVLAATASWGWSRSTTQHRLRRLTQEGLLRVGMHGRLKRYSVAADAPMRQSAPDAGAARLTTVG